MIDTTYETPNLITPDYKVISTEKTLIIYHQISNGVDCADGIAGAWVASKAFPSFDLVGGIYQQGVPECLLLHRYKNVVIVDFSYKKDVLENLVTTMPDKNFYLIDHHVSALNDLANLSAQVKDLANLKVEFNMSESGATLAWKYFFPELPMPSFLPYVKDRDLWQHKLLNTHEVHEAFNVLGRNFKLFDEIAGMTTNDLLEYLVPYGEPIVEASRLRINELTSRVRFMEVAGHKNIPVVKIEEANDTKYISDVCQALYKTFPRALFVACEHKGKWSLRSDRDGNNTDVSAIAISKGGGGHHSAAGFIELIE